MHIGRSRCVFLIAAILLASVEAGDTLDKTALHRAAFDSYYADFVRRNPEAFLRQRVAIVAPDELKTLNALNSTISTWDQIFRALPKPSLSIGVEPFSVDYDLDQLDALRDLVARTPLGVGQAADDNLDAAVRDYIRTHPEEVRGTADVIYDVYRSGKQSGTSTTFTPDQVAMLKTEYDSDAAADGTLPKPTDSLESLLVNAPPAFDRALRAMDATKTDAQLAALRSDVDSLQKFVSDHLPPAATEEEIKELLDGVVPELRDVASYIHDQRDAQARVKRSQDIHAAIDIASVFLQTIDPKAGRTFAVIAHQTVIAAEAVAGMATGLTLTGVGAVVVAGFAISQALGDQGPSAEEQLQKFILELYHDIMAELQAIKRGLYEIRVQLAAIDSRIAELQLNSSIGFSRVLQAINDAQATLKGLALESAHFYQAAIVDKALTAHGALVDLTTNPAQAVLRDQLSNPASAIAAIAQQNLSTIATLGLQQAKISPFSEPVQLDGAHVYGTPRVDVVENRVGDLLGLSDLLMPLGAPATPAAFASLSHSVALAQSVIWYTDARDRLPRPAQADANFGLLCSEASRVAAAARQARLLTPYAMRFAASAAAHALPIARDALRGSGAPTDTAYLRGTAVPPIPNDPEKELDAVSFGKPAGFATSFWLIAEPVQPTMRTPTADDLAQLGNSPFLPQPGPNDQVAVFDGCAILEKVAFEGVPKVQRNALGFKQYDAPRLYIRDKRKYCSDTHPLVAFPAETFGYKLENASLDYPTTAPEEALSPAELDQNRTGLGRITRRLQLMRGKNLADLAREDGIVSVPPSRRVNNTHQLHPDPFHPVFDIAGCVDWRLEAIWSDEARTVLPSETKAPAWTYAVEEICTPSGGVHAEDFEAFLQSERHAGHIQYPELPDYALQQYLETLEEVITAVQTRRATGVVNAWTSRMAKADDPLTLAVDDVRLARYALETFARYGYADCSDPGDVVHSALLQVTCGGDRACARAATDVRMKSGSAYLDFADAVDELSAISSLGENANALQSELAKDPELCKDAGPYGLATALAVLNGLARRSEQFLPNGCTP